MRHVFMLCAVAAGTACGGDDFTTGGSGGGAGGTHAGGTGGSTASGGSSGGGGVPTGGVGGSGASGGSGGYAGAGLAGGAGAGGGIAGSPSGGSGGTSSDAGVVYGKGTCPATKPEKDSPCSGSAFCCYGWDEEYVVLCAPVTGNDGGLTSEWKYSGSSKCCPSAEPTDGTECATNGNLVCCYGGNKHTCNQIPLVDVWAISTSACSNG